MAKIESKTIEDVDINEKISKKTTIKTKELAKGQEKTKVKFDELNHEMVRAKDLHISRVGGWLESRFHFRFAGWYPRDKKRHGFGALHVLNDDLVKPQSGFGLHPHNNQEIFSYILNGYLTHKDSEGNAETLGRGSIQYMSAGKGVWHSEYNNNKKEICRFLQIWIYPNAKGLDVQYGSMKIEKKYRHNKLLQILSGTTTNKNVKTKIALSQDVNIFVSELDYNKTIKYTLNKNRNIYFVCAEGECYINGGKPKLKTRDAVRIYGDNKNSYDIEIKATYKPTNKDEKGYPSCHFLMIEMDNKNTNWHRTQASLYKNE